MFTKMAGNRFCFKSLGAAVLTVLFCSLEAAAAPKVETFVSPEPVRVGETAYLVIRSNDGTRNAPLISRRPPVQNLEWGHGISQSESVQIINDQQSVVFEVRVPFTVSRPGNYTIPPFELTHSREKTKPVEFSAVEARYSITSPAPSASSAQAAPVTPQMPPPVYRQPGTTVARQATPPARQTAPATRTPQPSSEESVSPQDSGERSASGSNRKNTELTLDQVLFSDAEIPGLQRTRYYVGEEIPLEVNTYLLDGARAQLTWPKITFGEKDAAVFRDYKNVNPDNPNFSGAAKSSAEKNGRDYTVYSFKTAFRPISAGKMTIAARVESVLLVPDNRRAARSDDMFEDFFGGSFLSREQRVARNMETTPITIDVLKVPPPEDNAFFSGLVGLWKTDVTLSPPPYRVGEPITMKVNFQGTGSLDTLRARPLELKGFRVYPPEIEKNRNSGEIRYILIPTEISSGDTENIVLPPVSTFNPVTGSHVVTDFRRKAAIEKGSSTLPQNAAYVVESSTPSENAEQESAKRRPEEVLYLKKLDNGGGGVFMPLWRNMLFSGITVVLFGLIFWLTAEWIRFRRSVRENDPMFQRRAGAKKARRELFARIAVMDPEDIPGKCSGEIASYVSDTLGLPPGADLNECAKALGHKSPELTEMLEELSQAAWVPSMKSRFTKEFRASLLKALGKLGIVLLMMGALTLPGAEIALKKEIPIRNDAEAMTAYDAGQFDAAGQYYAAQLKKSRPSAKILYNMGNCLYRMGELPKALICYERALRLSPRDSDILENLNLVRRKLGLPEKYKIATPSDIPPYLRDSLRPDEWMFLFCCGWALLFVALGFRALKLNRILVRSAAAAGLVLLIFPAAAHLSQGRTSYSPDYAIVTVRNLPVYSLPSAQSGKIEMKLKAGEELSIVERRLDWVRIRSGDAEGWVRAKDISSLWMPNSISTN